jgi:hypothetical protein
MRRHYCEKEIEFIKHRLSALHNEGLDLRNICLVTRTSKMRDIYRQSLEAAGFDVYTVKKKSSDKSKHGGVRLANMHRIKGLEFDVMIVAGGNDGEVPLVYKGSRFRGQRVCGGGTRNQRALLAVRGGHQGQPNCPALRQHSPSWRGQPEGVTLLMSLLHPKLDARMQTVQKETIADSLILENLAELHKIRETIRLLQEKHQCTFEAFEVALQQDEEDFQSYDDYIDWKAAIQWKRELEQRIDELKHGRFRVA